MSLPKGEVVRISSKGQIVIPKGIRDALQLRAGAQLVIQGRSDFIVMLPLQSYTEMLKRMGKTLTSGRDS